jgi:DtxR family Mn-dependent transcriptional regulator
MVKNKLKRPRARSAAVDQYLHAMMLLTDHGQQADTGDLAAKVGVTPAAASQMLKKLAELGLVKLEPYRGADLTTEGLHRALRVVRRHRLLELFLHKIMGFDLQDLHARASALESVIDEVFEERMDAMLGSPKIDPHGRPIPGKNVTWPKLGDSPLLDLPPGTTGEVSRITTDSAEAIKYLHRLGLTRGAVIVLEGVAPFDGPVSVRVKGNIVHLGRRLAQMLHVSEEGRRQTLDAVKPIGRGAPKDRAS